MVRSQPPIAAGVQAEGASRKKERSSTSPRVSEGLGAGPSALHAKVWTSGPPCEASAVLAASRYPAGRFTNTA